MNAMQMLIGFLGGILAATVIIWCLSTQFARKPQLTLPVSAIMGMLLAMTMIILASSWGTQLWQLSTMSTVTQGVVVNVDRCGTKGNHVAPIVQFTDANGIHHVESITGSCVNASTYSIGEQIELRYVSNDPTVVTVAQEDLGFDAMVTIAILVGLFMLVVWSFIVFVRKMRADGKAYRSSYGSGRPTP